MDDAAEQARKARLAAARERLRSALVRLREAEDARDRAMRPKPKLVYSAPTSYDESLTTPESTRTQVRAYPNSLISKLIGNAFAPDTGKGSFFIPGRLGGAAKLDCRDPILMTKPMSPLTRIHQRNSMRRRLRSNEITVAKATTNGANMANTEPIDHHDELRGRLAAIETLLLTLTAYTASHVERNGGDLVTFSAAIFREVENELQDAAAAAAGTENEAAARLALETHRSLAQQMMPQLNRHRVLER